MAGLSLEAGDGAVGLEVVVRGGQLSECQPRARSNGHAVDLAGAVHACCLLDGVALLGSALVQGAVVFVVAKEFIGAVVAVLHAVATLLVAHDLAAGAHKAMGKARASNVVAGMGSAKNHGESKNDEADAHSC